MVEEAEKKEKILVVDDDEGSCMLLRRILSASYEVHIAASVAEAVTLLEKVVFDLVILDINMPDTDGISFAEEIRKDPSLEYLYILFMTANLMKNVLSEAMKYGDGYITKPITVDEFPDQVRALLESGNRKPPENKKVA